MDSTEFMCVLIDELDKKSFIGIEVHKIYSKSKKVFVFIISAERKGKNYTFSFNVKENCLNYSTIEEIVNWYSMK